MQTQLNLTDVSASESFDDANINLMQEDSSNKLKSEDFSIKKIKSNRTKTKLTTLKEKVLKLNNYPV